MGDLLGEFMWESPDRREAIISSFDRDFERILLGLPLSDEDERTAVSEAEVDEAIYDSTYIQRREAMPTREQLAREVKRHQNRLDAAQARLDALEGIPERDPFVDGAALMYHTPGRSGALLTFVSARIDGRWWSTGRSMGVQGVGWPALVDWWLEHKVTQITLLTPGETLDLAGLPEPEQAKTVDTISLPRAKCPGWGGPHGPHSWYTSEDVTVDPIDRMARCPGTE